MPTPVPPPVPWLPARTAALPWRALAPGLLLGALFDLLLVGLLALVVLLGVPRLLAAQSAPSLSAAPHNGDARRVGLCAAGCFDASAAYSGPAYVSLDQPRSVSLVYSSAQAAPRALVQVDATDNSSTPPSKMSIRLKRSDGSWVTFSNGSQEIFFQSGSGTTRLSAQFDASALATGAYGHTAGVRSWRSDGSFAESTVPVRVLVLNERNSPYGAGWTVGGLQRVLPQSDGSVVVSEGDGSVLFFQKSGSSYLSPPGDFSTLTYDESNYFRRYPDGTEVRFYTNGLQNYVKDRFANRTTFNYDTNQRLIRVTDPAGKITNLAYGSDGKLATITDPTNRVSTITINTAGDLTTIQDPGGRNALLATYDSSHRLKKRTDRRGGTWGFAYWPAPVCCTGVYESTSE